MAKAYTLEEVRKILDLQTQYKEVITHYEQPSQIQFISQQNHDKLLDVKERLQGFPKVFSDELAVVDRIIDGLEGKVQNI